MRFGRAAVVALLILGTTDVARGDGKLFLKNGRLPPTIPDQSAFIRYADGVQYLAIETRFIVPREKAAVGEPSEPGESGSAVPLTGEEELAWIIPLPAAPDLIEPVTPGLFPTLRSIYSPTIIRETQGDINFLLALPLMFALLYWAVSKTDTKQPFLATLLIFPLVFFMCLFFFTGSLARPRGFLPADVTVHSRSVVGSYDTAVLSATSAGDLLGWLETNGFSAPSEIEPVVDRYLAEGWVFVAAKLRVSGGGESGEESESFAPHPVGFAFRTERCVYPLRLTAVGSGPIDLEVYVAAEGRAAAAGLEVKHCEQLAGRFAVDPEDRRDGAPHTEFRRVAGDAPVLTKLAGRFDPALHPGDLDITFVPYMAHETVFYSRRAAMSVAWTAMLIAAVALLAICTIVGKLFSIRKRWLWGVAIVAVIAGGETAYMLLPRPPRAPSRVSSEAPPPFVIYAQHKDVYIALYQMMVNHPEEVVTGSLIDARAGEAWRGELRYYVGRESPVINPFSGRHVGVEDSPGNYIVRDRDGCVEYIWFDEDGREHAEWFTDGCSNER